MLLHNCKREIAKLNSNNVIIFFPNFKNLPMQLQSEGYCVDLKKKKQTVSYKNFNQKNSYKLFFFKF